MVTCLLTACQPITPTQPLVPPGSVNEDQLRPGKAKVSLDHFVPFVDKRVRVQVKLCNPSDSACHT